jgi:cysteine synthase/rhodanese-related sulfurtransferase
LQEQNAANIDNVLLENFEKEIWNKVPHIEKSDELRVINPTPLIDITEDLRECARKEFGLNLSDKDLKVFGKFDSKLLGGSIKVRPAVNIIHDAILKGKIKSGQTIFEATSGNFGIALGLLSKLGLDVVTLVSRKLQEGVFEELRNEKTRILNLDMDICPAPGMKDNQNLLMARATAANIRSQLAELGFDPAIFYNASTEALSLLAAQDIINLAKLLAKIYAGCFCPEQYDNELNVDVHKTVTAPEIDQQLHENGQSLSDYRIVCTFGTGGTSGGLSRYFTEKYGKKSLHVVFPLGNQDVAGIRTKSKASGLKFYEPDKYAGQHEVDFEQAKLLLKFFVNKGYDMGESSALAFYAVLQMANFDFGGKFVVIVADGIQKYKKNLEAIGKKQTRIEVPLQDAVSNIKDYDRVIWVHTQYTPREEGIELMAKTLGVDKEKITVPKARDVERLIATQQIPESLNKSLEGSHGKTLLVCMAGNTSLMAAKVLASKGIATESLTGGISAISQVQGKQIFELIKIATE